MAAHQQKKRLISSSLHEHYRGKKKKRLDTSDPVLNLRSQIYLEWDDNQKKVVAKREQIGITWKDMAPFVNSVTQCHSRFADVLCVPREIYSLHNLMEVLSYEVWATCLSESDRKLLTQFLPSGTGEQAIQSLLSGENLQFVNPFIRWSMSLCSGTLHPDDVLRREQQINSIKKGYYSDLNKYHTNMLEGLKKLKDQWSRCNDPEKLWRQDLIKQKESSLPISSKRAKEVPQKVFIRNGDTAKYMSYIKVTKKQHDAIKNLKCSGDGILSKSLSHVLGDINAFCVQPYEALEGEEKLRLHKHWLQVVNIHLPMAFEVRKEMKLQREQLKKCLEQELPEKRTLILDKTRTNHFEISPQEKIEHGESEHGPNDVLVQEVSLSVNPEHSHHMERIPSLNSHPELVGPVALDKQLVGHVVPTLGDSSPVLSQFNGNENVVEGLMEAKAKEIWQAVDGPQCNSSSDFSQLKPESIEEHRLPIIDLERDHDIGESNDASLFSLYASQRILDHLPSFAKGPDTLSPYPHAHMNHLKQTDLQFLMANGSLSETVQFPQFQHQQNLIVHSHTQENRSSSFSNGIYPNQELYSSANGDLLERAQNNYWPGVESSASNSDGSLFSVLSGCRNVQPQSLNTTTNSDYLIEARNFSTNGNNVYSYVPHQFKSSNSHEAAVVSTTGMHVPWMNYQQQQNSNMQDSIGKPFLRPWNQ